MVNRRSLLGSIAGTGAMVGLALVPGAEAAAPYLTCTPASPTPGQHVAIRGYNFPPGGHSILSWDTATAGFTVLATSGGTFGKTMIVPAAVGLHVLHSRRVEDTASLVITVKAPTPTTGGLLAMASSSRNTEIPRWLEINDPIFDPTSPLYLAIRNQLKPKIVRWTNANTFDDGLTIAFIQKACAAIRDWGAVLWIKGPTHGSNSLSSQRYCMPKYTAADLVQKFGAIYDALAVEFPGGFFAEHQNEVDLCADQAAAGTLVADHWVKVAVPVRKAFQAAHTNCKVVWVMGSLTNFGGPRWGNTTSIYSEPVDAIWSGVKAAWSAAPAADKPLYVPDVFSAHYYISDFTVPVTSTLAQIDPAIAYLGLASRTFQDKANAAFPGAGIKFAWSELNVDQAGNQHAEWPARCAYAYPKMAAMHAANNVWQSIQFVANGDSRTPAEAATGCPDMADLQGNLINGGSAFLNFT